MKAVLTAGEWWAMAGLAVVAGWAVSLAIAGPSSVAWMYGAVPVVWLAAAWGLRRWGVSGGRGVTLGFAAADLLLLAVPLAQAGVLELMELGVLAGLRGLAFGLLAGRPVEGRLGRVSAVVSAFVLVFATGLAPEGVRPLLLMLGAAAGAGVLVAVHAAARHGCLGVSLAWAAALTVGAVLVAAGVSGVLIRQDHSPSRGLWALLPTSGGTQTVSEQARSGVGDGPDEVRGGRDARTSGFDLGDVFVNSDHPGLYDAFIESFGQPVTRSEQMRMIGLKRQQILTSDNHTEQDLRSGRSLQVRRSAPGGGDRESRARQAGALLLVGGPAPMRVRMAVYDVYDVAEHAWFETPVPKQNAALYPNTPRPGWMQLVDAPESPLLGRPVRHEVRVGDIETDVLPLPGLTVAFKLGRVDRADFFAGGPEHVFRLFRRRIPEGSVLEVLSRPAVLGSEVAGQDPPARIERWADEVVLPPAVTELVERWTAGRAEGWEEVLAVVEGLRQHARWGAAGGEGLSEFLVQRRVGLAPEFASAAAVILRSRGYATRVAGGFYARPEAREARSGLVRVTAADAHVWPEVRTASGLWVPLEPTPGFELLPGTRTWGQWWASLAEAAWVWAWVWGPGAGVAGALWWVRRRVMSLAATAVWAVRPVRDPRERVRLTVELLRRRAALAGAAVQPHWSVRHFLERVDPDAGRLAALADWACYAPPSAPCPRADAVRVCRWAAGRLTYRHFRRMRRSAPPLGLHFTEIS